MCGVLDAHNILFHKNVKAPTKLQSPFCATYGGGKKINR